MSKYNNTTFMKVESWFSSFCATNFLTIFDVFTYWQQWKTLKNYQICRNTEKPCSTCHPFKCLTKIYIYLLLHYFSISTNYVSRKSHLRLPIISLRRRTSASYWFKLYCVSKYMNKNYNWIMIEIIIRAIVEL